ncbi:hypothetical protein COU78_00515 [Candidatus Peregrinibacteria bacterium CG10_big_fil_rev_8_21_14_0_10_49_24]|nr:MAG: hypothetical protein COV83_06670 [Candidatus Peregrinibacteria bacterium CG11_big_fil_rev_8_21_14_0_20_49_14]PIR51575.1 MAG: hypothetical protein COU78_00515 [Candidatus Peregrinibacteria bacterium CG10_big_fil_rev_8_21_14_0_10_49_24]PJA67112.1 MAG: hypothetical protein CO157_06310 [Candidatus Peregrinibacteria bacterium CG_4_9_14_3_um_filter_49_12]
MALISGPLNTADTLFSFFMDRHFSDRLSWQPPVRYANSRSLMDQIAAGAGRDIPLDDVRKTTDNMTMESRTAMLQRLMEQHRKKPTYADEDSTAYHEMMARIEANKVAPMLAAEMDDFMDPNVRLAGFANNT